MRLRLGHARDRYFRIIFAASFLLWTPTGAEAATPHGLSSEQKKRIMKMKESLGEGLSSGTAVADIMSCNPYCEKVGEVQIGNSAEFEDGLKIEVKDASERGNSIAWRFLKHRGGPGAAGGKGGPGQGGELKITVGTDKKGIKEDDDPEEETLKIKRRTPKYWVLHLDLGLYVGKRTWSTDSSTLTYVDAPFFTGGRYGASFRPPAFLHFEEYSPVFELGFLGQSNFSESNSSPDPDRDNNLTQYEFSFRTRVFHNEKEVYLSGVLGMNQMKFRTFTTNLSGSGTQNAKGFSWDQNSFYVGAIYKKQNWEFELDQTISGTVTDYATGVRGTSVSGGFTRVSGRHCKNMGLLAKFTIEPCVYLDLTFLSQKGAGEPDGPSFTANPTYSSSIWTIGINVNVIRFLGKPPVLEKFESMKTNNKIPSSQ